MPNSHPSGSGPEYDPKLDSAVEEIDRAVHGKFYDERKTLEELQGAKDEVDRKLAALKQSRDEILAHEHAESYALNTSEEE